MVLVRATAERLEFQRHIPVRSPVLVGVAFIALALLPLLAPGTVDATRIACSLALAVAGLALVRITRARVESFHVDLARHELTGPRTALSLDGATGIALAGTGHADLHPAARYRAELCLADGRRALLLENADPALLLRDLVRVLEHLDLPVLPGWGLPEHATPWITPAAKAPKARDGASAFAERALTSPFQRIAGLTTIGGGVFTMVAIGIMMTARLDRGESIAPLGVALPVATVLLAFLVGFGVLTDRTSITRNGALEVERRALGIRVGGLAIPVERIRQAWAVGPDPAQRRHVLLELDDGPVAFACAGDDAVRFAELIAS